MSEKVEKRDEEWNLPDMIRINRTISVEDSQFFLINVQTVAYLSFKALPHKTCLARKRNYVFNPTLLDRSIHSFYRYWSLDSSICVFKNTERRYDLRVFLDRVDVYNSIMPVLEPMVKN